MKHLLKCIFLSLVFLLPLTTYAELTGEVVFIHPDNPNELWITDLTDPDNAHVLYQQTHPIRDFSLQKNGGYIATITEYSANGPYDIYLIDTDNINQTERMMTHHRFNKILDLDLSQSPELIFTNYLPLRTNKNKSDRFGKVTSGIYMIRNKEIVDPTLPPPIPIPLNLQDIIPPRDVLSPRVVRIKGVEAQHVTLSPDSKYLAYDTLSGVYLTKFDTGEVLRVSIGGSIPIFSPDGTKLAVMYRKVHLFGFLYDLDIYSVPSLDRLKTIKNFNSKLNFFADIIDIKWSPDGEYIVYTTYTRLFGKQNITYYHYAIPYNGREQINLLNIFENGVSKFDWTRAESVYPIEPKNRLTTLWGKMKQ